MKNQGQEKRGSVSAKMRYEHRIHDKDDRLGSNEIFCFNSDPKRVRGAAAQSALKPGATLAVIALQA